jgi:hypothetical protein
MHHFSLYAPFQSDSILRFVARQSHMLLMVILFSSSCKPVSPSPRQAQMNTAEDELRLDSSAARESAADKDPGTRIGEEEDGESAYESADDRCPTAGDEYIAEESNLSALRECCQKLNFGNDACMNKDCWAPRVLTFIKDMVWNGCKTINSEARETGSTCASEYASFGCQGASQDWCNRCASYAPTTCQNLTICGANSGCGCGTPSAPDQEPEAQVEPEAPGKVNNELCLLHGLTCTPAECKQLDKERCAFAKDVCKWDSHKAIRSCVQI